MRDFAGRAFEAVVDRANPIVVKELRQAVQGRVVAGILLFFLLVQVVTLGIFLLTSGVDTVDLLSGSRHGREVFAILLSFLLFVSIVLLPAFAAGRLYVERSGEGLSLLYTTALKPRSIVAGKLAANLLVALLLFSSCLPFLSFTYFLRGIDLISIAVVLTFAFLVVAAVVQSMLFLVCLPGGRFLKVVLGMGGVVGLLITNGMAIGMSMAMIEGGVGSQLLSERFWQPVGAGLGIGGLSFLLVFLLTVASISPPAANRALPVRIFLSAAWLLSGVLAAVAALLYGEGDALEIWAMCWILTAGVALLVAISARDTIGLRLAQELPRKPARRALAFFFWSGSANGVGWALLTMATTLAAAFAALETPYMDSDDVRLYLGLGTYFFAYAMTAVLVHRRFLARRVAAGYTWVVALLMVAGGSLVPPIVAFLISSDPDWDNSLERWMFLNPFAVEDDRLGPAMTVFALIWAALATAASLPWWRRQLAAFRPSGAEEESASP